MLVWVCVLCVCVCVCVCLKINNYDVIRLGVNVNKVVLVYATTSPSRLASHSKDPWLFLSTLCLIVIKVGHSQWRRSCTLRRQFGQIGSWDGSSLLRYCLREGWWPDRRRSKRTSSFLLLICCASRETFWCW